MTQHSPVFPEPAQRSEATPFPECDDALATLEQNAQAWVELGISERIELLHRCMDTLLEVVDEWVEAACNAKGIERGSSGEGEEWLAGPMPVMRNLRLLVDALEQGGQPKVPAVREAHGRSIAQVFPVTTMDKVLFGGFQAEIWIEPGKPTSQGRIYREAHGDGRVALVLGAGNQSSIGPMDFLYKLFVDDEVVLLKMNPVNEYLGAYFERAFAPLIEAGYLDIVYGGADVGAYLCEHEKVGSIHITGSERTHDAIVWGATPEQQAKNKQAGKPRNTKPITSELGCVTPVLVVPGEWSDEDIDFQARQVTAMVTQNASFNCNAAKVLVLAKGWSQKEAFLAKLEAKLMARPGRKAYYPGAQDRYDAFLKHYPGAKALGERDDSVVPWTLLIDVAPEEGEYALGNEAFCGVLAVVELDVDDAAAFLDAAVPFCNDKVWGTLSANLLIDPKTAEANAARLQQAILDLRYGVIGVNAWSGVAYGLVVTTWGAYPGHPLEDIGSGRGVVHNSFLFDHPEKSVVRAPFRIKPTPAWFVDHRNLAALGRKLTHFEKSPSWLKVPGVVMQALKG